MSDQVHNETEKLIRQMEKRINAIYRQAHKEIDAKCDDYFRRYYIKDKMKREEMKAGIITAKEYAEWRKGQLMVGDRWLRMRNQLAQDMHKTNLIARSVIEGYMPEIYAINHNYGMYEAEIGSGIDLSYTLYNREAVENILRENPRLLPAPGKELQKRIAAGRDVLWNSQQIQSVMLQGILQGESIPNLAKRLRTEVSDSNRKASIRNARTMATTAQNAGRFDAYKRAESKGVKMQKTWVATLDGRTRHWHRELDGVTIPIDDYFITEYSELEYPGDRHGDPADLYNCRCTMIAQIAGFERDINEYRVIDQYNDDGTKMTYDEWKDAKATSQDIEHQEKVGNTIRGAHIRNYKKKAAEAKRRLNK